MDKEFVDNFQKAIWMNTKHIIKKNLKRTKPCHKLGYCPYGAMVEAFELKRKSDKVSCKTFGHDCPMFYNAEDLSEFGERRIKAEKEGKE